LREDAVSRRTVLGASGSAALAALAGCLGTDASTANAAPWPMQGHDAGRTNHRPNADPPRADVRVSWTTDLPGHWPPKHQPLAYDDLVLVPDRDLVAVDRADGTERFASLVDSEFER